MEVLDVLYKILMVVIWVLPAVYFLTNNKLETKEIKKRAVIYYLIVIFISILITGLFYGFDKTFKTIGNSFSHWLSIAFWGVVIIIVFGVILLLLLGNWRMLFDELRRKFRKK